MRSDVGEQTQRINSLSEELEKCKDAMTDMLFELNYSKEKELAEFVREIYHSIKTYDPEEPGLKGLSLEDILKNLKNRFEEFARNNKFKL